MKGTKHDYPHGSTVAVVLGSVVVLLLAIVFWKTATYGGVNKVKDILECIYYIVFVALSLFTAAYAAWQYKRSNTQRIIEKFDETVIREAFHLIESSFAEIGTYEDSGGSGRSKYWTKVCQAYRDSKPAKVRLAAPNLDSDLQMYLAAITLANYFQDVASMYEHGWVVEKTTVENQSGRLLGFGWELLEDFVVAERKLSRQRIGHSRW